MESVFDLLFRYHVGELLILVGVVMIVIDYLFDTDVPCHIGYACFAAAAFLWPPMSLMYRIGMAAVVWGILQLMHMLVFRQFLARDTPQGSGQ